MKVHEIVVLAVLAGSGVYTFSPGRAPNTIAVAGNTQKQPTGTAWGVLVCPPRGAIAKEVAFIVQNAAAGAGDATMVIENHTAGTTMCTLQVPCTTAATISVLGTCATGVACTSGDAIHIEWSANGCTADPPDGSGSGTLQEF